MSSLTPTAGVTRSFSTLTFDTSTVRSMHVFNISARLYDVNTINVWRFSRTVASSETVLINVFNEGAPGMTWAVHGSTSGVATSSNVLWNVYHSTITTVLMQSVSLSGTLLAPYATIQSTGGGTITGQLFAYRLTYVPLSHA